jgi:XTP/dITP diphosphohydrolase
LKIIIATNNPHKTEEIKNFFKGYPVEIYSKEKVDGIVIGDDTGVFVEYLNGQPGVYSARFAGENATYEDNNKKLLKLLEGVPYEKRKAYFKTVIAVVEREKETLLEGKLEGYILDRPRGKNGFGYDPIFYVDDLGKTLAELTMEEKNKISHRANALVKLKNYILQRLGEK